MLLGCIGDDFTGSGDLANTLAKQGMRVTQYSGIPNRPADADVEAGVVALKTRSVSPQDAIRLSLEALSWLQNQGCQQFFFKYCSTFDSTREGNIGPVADALADALGAQQVIFCPAFPATGRSLYQGHLFVADTLLNESGMRDHPLTPMTDSDIRRWLGHQSHYLVGHVAASNVFQGPDAIRKALVAQSDLGKRHIVVDAIRDVDLVHIGTAVRDHILITGGSGVAMGLPANFGKTPCTPDWDTYPGKSVILSGSCSVATRDQIAQHISNGHPTFKISAEGLINGDQSPNDIASWLIETEGLALAYSSTDPEEVALIQSKFGREKSSAAIESTFADVARQVVNAGIARLIVAGGETSGAVVEGLGLDALSIGPEIAAGVPALKASDQLVLALKSGNFGGIDFFEKADQMLAGNP